MSDSAATPQPCTTWSNRKKHLSLDLTPAEHGGRTGRTLCREWGYDDTALAARLYELVCKPPRPTADLPACKKCEARA